MSPTNIFIAYKKIITFCFPIGSCKNSYISLSAVCCCRAQWLLGAVGEQNKCAMQTNSSCWTLWQLHQVAVVIVQLLQKEKGSVAHKSLFLHKAVDYCWWIILLWFAWLLCLPFVLYLIFAFGMSGQHISQTLSSNPYLKYKWISSTGRTSIFTDEGLQRPQCQAFHYLCSFWVLHVITFVPFD